MRRFSFFVMRQILMVGRIEFESHLGRIPFLAHKPTHGPGHPL